MATPQPGDINSGDREVALCAEDTKKVASKDLGLRILWEPPNNDAIIDIVAIHGMAADPERTWVGKRDDGAKIDWLKDEDMLPGSIPNARIMRYGYESAGFGDQKVAMKVHASAIAQTLLKTLRMEREGYEYRPLIFIAHSFGGLIVLKALVHAKAEPHAYPGIYHLTIGLYTFSTPFRGTAPDFSGTIHEQSWLLEQAERVHKRVFKENYEIFRRGDHSLLDTVDEFLRATGGEVRPRVQCWYETKETNIGRMVEKTQDPRFVTLVDVHSGALDEDASTTKMPRARDHVNVQRFCEPDEQDFKLLIHHLKGTIKEGPAMIEKRWKTAQGFRGFSARANEKERDDVLFWLSASENSGIENTQITRRDRLRSLHETGTGGWIFDRKEYKIWVDYQNADDTKRRDHKLLLWLHGKPGAGKSVLVEQVAQALQYPLIAIFCEYDHREHQTRQRLLCCAIRQVVGYLDASKPIPEELRIIWKKYKTNKSGLPAEEASHLLIALVRYLGRCYIVLDGLDEYDAETKNTPPPQGRYPIDIFKDLHGVTQECRGSCRMLVASRTDLYHVFNQRIDCMNIEVVASTDDVAKYVTSRINNREFAHYERLSAKENQGLRQRIVETLCERAQGLFIIPFLHFQLIEPLPDLRSVKDSLEVLPTRLREIYSLILDHICRRAPSKQQSTGLQIIQIVLCVAMRLNVRELQHAHATRKGDTDFDPHGIVESHKILEQTGGLLSIDENNVVMFMHQTVVDYFREEDVFNDLFSNGYASLKEICYTYASFRVFKHPSSNIKQLQESYPFLRYAAMRLGYHMSQCIDRGEMEVDQAVEFLKDRKNMPMASLQVVASRVLTIPSADRMLPLITYSSDLHLAILWGIDRVIQTIVANADWHNLESMGFKDQRPIHYAARCLSIEATNTLLQNDVDVNSTEVEGRTALDLVITRPWRDATLRVSESLSLQHFLFELLKKYVEETKSSDSKKAEFRDWMQAEIHKMKAHGTRASKSNNFIEDMKKFRDHPGYSDRTVFLANLIIRELSLNISNAGETIAIALIEKGVDVNSIDVEDTSPLQLAALYGREKLVAVLLDKGANPFLKGLMGHTAFQIACIRAEKFPDAVAFKNIAKLLNAKMGHIKEEESKLTLDEDRLNLPGMAQMQLLTGKKQKAFEKMLRRFSMPVTNSELSHFTMPGSWDDAW